VKNFSLNFRIFLESENFQNLKMIESKKFSTKLLKAKNISLNLNFQNLNLKPKSENNVKIKNKNKTN